MERVPLRQLKNRLGLYLRKVRQGESLVLTDRGRPVARLVPEGSPLEARLEALATLGFLALGEGRLPDREPVTAGRASVADLLVEER